MVQIDLHVTVLIVVTTPNSKEKIFQTFSLPFSSSNSTALRLKMPLLLLLQKTCFSVPVFLPLWASSPAHSIRFLILLRPNAARWLRNLRRFRMFSAGGQQDRWARLSGWTLSQPVTMQGWRNSFFLSLIVFLSPAPSYTQTQSNIVPPLSGAICHMAAAQHLALICVGSRPCFLPGTRAEGGTGWVLFPALAHPESPRRCSDPLRRSQRKWGACEVAPPPRRKARVFTVNGSTHLFTADQRWSCTVLLLLLLHWLLAKTSSLAIHPMFTWVMGFLLFFYAS